MGLFSSSNNSCLGIDIGASGVKIVELKREGGKARLLNYGFNENKMEDVRDEWKNDTEYVAEVLNSVLNKSGMKTRTAVASLPTFAVFSSVLNLSNVSAKDIDSAVHWEAKKVIPLPLEEMILDWKEVSSTQATAGKNNVKVLLTGAPKSLVKKYMEIFRAAQINLLSLETETFSLIRALMGNDKSTVMIVEIGANTTDITIIDKSIPMLSRSVDIGGATITKILESNLGIDSVRAEQFKYDLGVGSMGSKEDVVPKTITESISPIVNEIKYSLSLFQNKNNIAVEKIILSGGSSLLTNVTGYLSRIIDKEVIIGDPWFRVSYPVELKPLLDEIGPRMSVAIGLAMRGVE